MYVYLYDNFLRENKYESTIKAIETRLTDFDIAGKILRLQNFANPQAIIEEEIKKGATVIVIVGDDNTFGNVLSRGAACNVLFGFLPVCPFKFIPTQNSVPFLHPIHLLSVPGAPKITIGINILIGTFFQPLNEEKIFP